MTFEMIARAEPEIARLYRIAGTIKDDGASKFFCANEVWYHMLKPRLIRVVGWERESQEHPFLMTSQAYSIAYGTIYEKLPSCRDCACL